MRAARCEAVIELGPRSVLSGYAAASLPGAAALALVRGTEKGSELRDAFEAVAQLWLGGAEVRWAALLQRGPAGADFPRMPWLHAVNAGGGAAAFHSSKSSGARTIEHVVAVASKALVQVPALITAAAVLPAEKHAAAATPVNGAGGGVRRSSLASRKSPEQHQPARTVTFAGTGVSATGRLAALADAAGPPHAKDGACCKGDSGPSTITGADKSCGVAAAPNGRHRSSFVRAEAPWEGSSDDGFASAEDQELPASRRTLALTAPARPA
jgi:hypothetical protein